MPKKIDPKKSPRTTAYELWTKAPNPMVTFLKTFKAIWKTPYGSHRITLTRTYLITIWSSAHRRSLKPSLTELSA